MVRTVLVVSCQVSPDRLTAGGRCLWCGLGRHTWLNRVTRWHGGMEGHCNSTWPRFLAIKAMDRAAMRGAFAKTSSSLGHPMSRSSAWRKKLGRSILQCPTPLGRAFNDCELGLS